MTKTISDHDFKLLFAPPWEDINDYPKETREGLLKELKRELHRHHPLYRQKLTLIGRRQDNDDILVETESKQIAVVHLTWTGGKERRGFPSTKVYESKKDFWERAMRMNIEDFNL